MGEQMIWRVLKKDAYLLRWLVLVVLAVRLGQAVMSFSGGIAPNMDDRSIEDFLETFVGYIASAVLIVMAVHQDGLIGSTQDWLVRPIDRRLLLLAKLLFALAAVLLPYFLVKFVIGVFHGFAIADTLLGAFVATMLAFAFLVLPALMLGAVTRTLAQGMAIAIGALLTMVFLGMLAQHFGAAFAINQAPFRWQGTVLQALVVVVGAPAVLWLAYVRRNVLWARIGCGITFAAFLALYLIPFDAVFALQQAMEPNPKAADTIRIAYDPSVPPSHFVATEHGFVSRDGKQIAPAMIVRGLSFVIGVGRNLPIRITGLPADAVVRVDYLGLRLVSADGRVLYRTAEKNRFLTWLLNEDDGQSFKLYNGGPGLAVRAFHQQFSLPPEVYHAIENVPLHVEVDYALSVLGRRATAVVPALFSSRTVAGLGICGSRIGSNVPDTIEIWCRRTSDNAHCSLVTAEDTATGARNPLSDQCEPDYQPRLLAAAEKLAPAMPVIFFAYPPYADKAHFPVSLAQISTTRLAIASYGPQAHVWRHVATPLLRLSDLK